MKKWKLDRYGGEHGRYIVRDQDGKFITSTMRKADADAIISDHHAGLLMYDALQDAKRLLKGWHHDERTWKSYQDTHMIRINFAIEGYELLHKGDTP